MKTIAALGLAAALTVIPSLSQAQQAPNAAGATSQPQGSPDSAQQGNNKAPDQEKGSTGWGGGSKAQGSQGNPIDPVTGQSVKVNDEVKAKDQPALASGEDLKGPPVQFPPSKTPE